MPKPPPKNKIKRGAIALLPFPNSDLRTAKLRPAVIVQADDLKTGLAQVIIAMISSNLDRAGHPSRVLIEISGEQGKMSGLLFNSAVMTDNLATVAVPQIVRIIGQITNFDEIDKSLRKTLNL